MSQRPDQFHSSRYSEQSLQHAKYHGARRATYVALDVPDWEAASHMVSLLGDAVDGYKVGLELFHGDGPQVLEQLTRLGKRVFLDVKLHDIPNTVAGALRSICRSYKIEMVNVHASGGQRMLSAARNAIDAVTIAAEKPLLIAVTVLTSLDEGDFESLGWSQSASDTVVRWASLAQLCGLDGVVASAKEIELIRANTASDFEIVVPGTRPTGSDTHDQKRSLTPAEAYAAGATRLVLGRAVTGTANPMSAIGEIWDDMIAVNPEKLPDNLYI